MHSMSDPPEFPPNSDPSLIRLRSCRFGKVKVGNIGKTRLCAGDPTLSRKNKKGKQKTCKIMLSNVSIGMFSTDTQNISTV